MKDVLYKCCWARWGFAAFLGDFYYGTVWYHTERMFYLGFYVATWLSFDLWLVNQEAVRFWITGPVLAFVGIVVLWGCMLARITVFYPFPMCINHVCRSISDYDWPMGTLFGRSGWGVYRYKCSCGDEYVRRGRQFFRVLPSSVEIPYVVSHPKSSAP